MTDQERAKVVEGVSAAVETYMEAIRDLDL
jgi:hypothetical protein